MYPQLRLPSQYAELACKKASIYEIRESARDIAFIILFNAKNSAAANYERAERAEGHVSAREPCRGSDLGSNPD